MNHTITIKNLGPLKDIENFEIKDINLIIGESASGKSVLANAIFFFNEFFGMRRMDEDDNIDSLKEQVESDITKTLAPYNNYYIKYSFTEDSYIEIDRSQKLEKVTFSNKFQKELDRTIKEMKNVYQSIELERTAERLAKMLSKSESKLEFKQIEEIQKLATGSITAPIRIYEKFSDSLKIQDTYFIPAVRSSYLDNPLSYNLRGSYSGRYRQREIADDSKLANFLYLYRRAQGMSEENLINMSAESQKIMKGNFVSTKNGIQFQPHNSEETLATEYLSSGQKAVLPILQILYYLEHDDEKCLLIIEEPEAHIFPTDQRAIFDEIVKFANVTGSRILITTHSPYPLLGANNLLKAYVGGLPKYQDVAIDSKRLNASKLENGEFESLINGESNLISSEYLESVVDEIMVDFEEIIKATPSYDYQFTTDDQ